MHAFSSNDDMPYSEFSRNQDVDSVTPINLRRSINKLMRALNGNTAPTESHLRISAFNTNGLTVLGRWHLLLDRDFDICMISETHCTALHQKSLDYDERVFGHMGCTCSIPISQWSHVALPESVPFGLFKPCHSLNRSASNILMKADFS